MRFHRAPIVIRLKMAQSPPKPIDDPQREEKLLQNILRKNRELQNGILDENLIMNFFVSQIEAGKMLQRELSLPENKKELESISIKDYPSLDAVRDDINILDESILNELANTLNNKNIHSKKECLKSKNVILTREWKRSSEMNKKGENTVNVEIVRMKALKDCLDKVCDLFNF
uniref:Chorismate mutase domain-containing protein n=1 Tax=Meloidogyne enterolobii TaxID=390850 RepID=A0A6V7XED2_MELEN|nr:unnamed protein product [Meloidogyne enterolobii]